LAAQLAIRDSALILSYIFENFEEVGNTEKSLDLFFIEKIKNRILDEILRKN
jgi:hypothetical protein